MPPQSERDNYEGALGAFVRDRLAAAESLASRSA
jgi:hypothetical protein